MGTYLEELATEKHYKGNVVILLGGVYYAIRTPDSGLPFLRPQNALVSSLVLNPTQISPKNVQTTIASYSFKLLDKNGVLSRIVKDTGQSLIGTEVKIWLGRSDTGMDFADYYQLPSTRVSKISKADAGYTFSTREYTDRMNVPIYAAKGRVQGNIFAATTTLVSKDDISAFPAAGSLRIDNEIISYTSKTDGSRQFNGCVRGLFTTTPHDITDDTEIQMCETVVDNPLNIILQLITSGGGGSAYDVLNDGLAIGQNLIDITEIESIRDELFDGVLFSLAFYDIDSALKYIEDQLLAPCNLRFSFSSNSKLTMAVLDQAVFVSEDEIINHDTLTAHPQLDIADSEVVNSMQISWDFDEDTQKYGQIQTFQDDDSIDTYGITASPLKFEFKGISDDDFVSAFATALLLRLAQPSPTVQVKTQLDKSVLNVGDKTVLETVRLPNETGELNFASSMEVISRAINYQNGEVTLKLAYTSFTGIRTCWIAPSDTIDSVTDQSTVELPTGQGSFWSAGWKVRLWNNLTNAYEADAVNTIESVTGDVIAFVDAWATTLTTNHRLKFADYDQVIPAQLRYCFISPTGLDFQDGGKSYKIIP